MSATFSIYSAPQFAYGDDWPAWQRDLYPVTYQRDAEFVENRAAALREELSWSRRYLHVYLKERDARSVARYRADIERKERWLKNCETQLRLIANARPRLTAGRDLDATMRSLSTPAIAAFLQGAA